ncbi:putative transcription factor TGA like domain-containing protein [Rosa chinensis]|uniref:Putative transcription factor TGA like domain-containing protein n=1 Tax=Rosa chinensis TaxID=74649 RepID=A0A2P6P878_ROSCH|nr:protein INAPERTURATE POLLEN1 [Rosa chinensis]PRQ18117.1 putative transcription factor TGA like domain-containing protein [Rosa chinensis]
MLKAVGLFGRSSNNKKSPRPFKDYYSEWLTTLKSSLLPSLRQSLSDASSLPNLSLHVDALHRHFLSYYDALDSAAQSDVAQLLFPDWRNPLEKPFLWLADLHPYLFTNLLRSFLDSASDEDSDADSDSLVVQFGDRPWHIATAWRSPSSSLTQKVEQVECGLRLMVPALAARARDGQAAFVERVARNWGPYDAGKKEAAKAVMAEAMEAEMEEMVSVLVDANRLRRSVLAEIVGAASVYQAALFLEGLAQFLVGFRNPELLAQFDQCKTPLSKQCRLAI